MSDALSRKELLIYERSSMASCWTEMLCLEKLGNGQWKLGAFSPRWFGNIYELIPDDRHWFLGTFPETNQPEDFR